MKNGLISCTFSQALYMNNFAHKCNEKTDSIFVHYESNYYSHSFVIASSLRLI